MQSQSNLGTNQSPFSSPNREKSDTMFKRLNKLANTKLKGYVGGKQLISLDIQSHSSTTSQILTMSSQSHTTFTARERYLNTISRKPQVETITNTITTTPSSNDVLKRHQPVVNLKTKMVESSNKVINQIRSERRATNTRSILKEEDSGKARMDHQRAMRGSQREEIYSSLNLSEESENRNKLV
jgi:hypothetical protein